MHDHRFDNIATSAKREKPAQFPAPAYSLPAPIGPCRATAQPRPAPELLHHTPAARCRATSGASLTPTRPRPCPSHPYARPALYDSSMELCNSTLKSWFFARNQCFFALSACASALALCPVTINHCDDALSACNSALNEPENCATLPKSHMRSALLARMADNG